MRQYSQKKQEPGQIMIGFYVGIMGVLLILLAVSSYFITSRKNATHRQMQDMAIQVAYEGFEEGLSYFQRQPGGVFLPASIRPSNDLIPVTGTVESYPDDAFRPESGDTDVFVTVTTQSPGISCSAAIIRDFSLHISRTVSTGNAPYHGGVWGRFVIKRQTVRNWTPGNNTSDANTDPEAAHDITMQKVFDDTAAIGAGLWWSITSRGYVYLGSGTQAVGVSDDVTATNSTVDNSLTSSPLATYNNRPLLLATAKVYGELNRISINSPDAALYVASASTQISGNSFGFVDAGSGTNGFAVASANGGLMSGPTYEGPAGNEYASPDPPSPAVGNVFPGMTVNNLETDAGSTYTGDVGILPNMQLSLTFTTAVSTSTFYFLERGNNPSVTFTFNQGTTTSALNAAGSATGNTFQGTGLLFVYGNLYIAPGAVAAWDGIVYVDGNATLNGPTQIYGELICTGNVYIGGTTNQANVEYNSGAVTSTEQLIQNFQVYKPSVVISYN